MPRDKSPVVYEGLTPEAEQMLASATPPQQAFALELAKGSSAAEAYRRAFPRSRAWQPNSVWPKASKLARDDKVKLLVGELRKGGADLTEHGKRSLGSHVSRLTELSYEAQATGNYGAAVAAEISVGKASDLYTEKHVVVTETPEAVRAELARFLGISDPEQLTIEHEQDG